MSALSPMWHLHKKRHIEREDLGTRFSACRRSLERALLADHSQDDLAPTLYANLRTYNWPKFRGSSDQGRHSLRLRTAFGDIDLRWAHVSTGVTAKNPGRPRSAR